jgi:hypothetical protein
MGFEGTYAWWIGGNVEGKLVAWFTTLDEGTAKILVIRVEYPLADPKLDPVKSRIQTMSATHFTADLSEIIVQK